MTFLLTCEHAGNFIPFEFRELFGSAKKTLDSHRGYDLGALDLFSALSPLADYSYSHEISRLLVELNRSLHHPQLFSEYTRSLSSERKKEILDQYYHPYRAAVEAKISEITRDGGEVLHISVHSFTPILNGEVRTTDIGLLYDPSSIVEKRVCKEFKNQLKKVNPELVSRFNYPYLGTADGFPTYLRRRFRKAYYGIELEVNQKFVSTDKQMSSSIINDIYLVFKSLKAECLNDE